MLSEPLEYRGTSFGKPHAAICLVKPGLTIGCCLPGLTIGCCRASKSLGDNVPLLCLSCGVTLGFLKAFYEAHPECAIKTTYEVVRDVIKPLTRSRRCRFVELPEATASRAVGKAQVFVSHTWGAPFSLLVSALIVAFDGDDDMVAWIDIFAVRQWPGNDGDLGFASIVDEMSALVLVCTHLHSIAELRPESEPRAVTPWELTEREKEREMDRINTSREEETIDVRIFQTAVPKDALDSVAFFRIW